MLGIKLLNRKGDESDFVEFDLNDVNYIDMLRPTDSSCKVPAYHTADGSYLAIWTLNDLQEVYGGFGFRRYGGSTIVNENRVAEKIPDESGTTVVFLCGSRVHVRKKFKK